MFRTLGSLATLVLALVATGCSVVGGDGHVVTREIPTGSFDAIRVSHALQAKWTVGAAGTPAQLTGEENLLELVDVRAEGTTLVLEVKQDGVLLAMNEPIVLAFTAPSLKSVELSGASQFEVEGTVTGEAFTVEASGASQATIPALDVGALSIELSGASQARVTGTADTAAVVASGGSFVEASKLVAGTLEIDLSGGSMTVIEVTDTMSGELSGGSHLNVTGRPTGNVKTSGGSAVETH